MAMASSSFLSLILFVLVVGGCKGMKKTYIVRVDSGQKPSTFPTHLHWYSSPSLAADTASLLHVYDTIFHGFSVHLDPDRAAFLASHPAVLAVFEDKRRDFHTTRSPQFLGLRTQHGLWSGSDYGSDVVIGVLDTGVWPERRSFSDMGLGPVPARWRGPCDLPSSLCNRKLVGARSFFRGAAAAAGGEVNITVEFLSPRDADGHGTHTASTAAGRHAFDASLAGYAPGVAKGVAPKARVAAYKVCWRGHGCLDSDILAGFDRAVADGVDVVSLSIGGGDGVATPYYLDPIAVGAYGAVSRGVFVSTSAGNDGPAAMSVANLAPWITTVGAGTIDRSFPADVVLGDGRKMTGVSLYSGKGINGSSMYPIVYPGNVRGLSASLCMENALDRTVVSGKIVICDRGSNSRVDKGRLVKEAGGVGMILVNGVSSGEGIVGDAHVLPTVALGYLEGDVVKAYAASGNATATMAFLGTVVGVRPAPAVASFSGRGPNILTPELLKPDIIAPGVDILAAWTDAVGPTGMDYDKRRTEFSILSGTSMACPHVSGAAALLRSAHPSWSPAAIRSAMMTTASTTDNTMGPLRDESTGRPATALDFGAGHLNLDRAIDPGLVYDMGDADYIRFLCAVGYHPRTIQMITHVPATCPVLRPTVESVNYPSFSAVFDAGFVTVQVKTFIRTLTNVGPAAAAVYRVRVETMSGMEEVDVKVKPRKLVFSEASKAQTFVVTVTAAAATTVMPAWKMGQGYLIWSDGLHEVRSPIVVVRVQHLADGLLVKVPIG